MVYVWRIPWGIDFIKYYEAVEMKRNTSPILIYKTYILCRQAFFKKLINEIPPCSFSGLRNLSRVWQGHRHV